MFNWYIIGWEKTWAKPVSYDFWNSISYIVTPMVYFGKLDIIMFTITIFGFSIWILYDISESDPLYEGHFYSCKDFYCFHYLEWLLLLYSFEKKHKFC